MKKVALILSGCGYLDGSEITESVGAMIALGQLEVEYQCFAPRLKFESVDHIGGNLSDQRDTFTESARICRGELKDLSELKCKEFDALLFPGGFGAAKHLCSWATEGSQCHVNDETERLVQEFYKASKPIGALCIAPALVAKVLGNNGVTVTIGNDPETAQEVEKTGAHHEDCTVDDFISDRENKIVTSPAYMYDKARPHEVFKGIFGLVKELTEMA